MNLPDQPSTLSEYERLALDGTINLSDGHARQPLSERQRRIIARSSELFDASLTQTQKQIEAAFLTHFFLCARQRVRSDRDFIFLTFSSSSAIKIAAQYCRLRGLRVCLIEPCFDNIVHLLRTEGVALTPVPEQRLNEIHLWASELTPDVAVWIVQPNNPTGFCMEEQAFRRLILTVAQRQATLIIDLSFRFYADMLRQWDQYQSLRESNAAFLCFEDTGKTWSLADIKVGITVCSGQIAPLIYRLHDELLLNVSAFDLLLLDEFVKDTLRHGLNETICRTVDINRQLVHALVQEGLVLHATQSCQHVPMELLCLPGGRVSAEFWASLRRRGVHVLPASSYFWSRPELGRSLFRIPLARPERDIRVASNIMRETLREVTP